MRAMSYDDLASTSAFLAGRDAARTLRRDGVGFTADSWHEVCPRGMHPDDTEAWIRGWRSIWA